MLQFATICSMDIQQLLEQGRTIWGPEKLTVDQVAVLLNVVSGDISRQARNQLEGASVDDQELQKELGNLIFSAIRWCESLGYTPEECIKLAIAAQQRYAASSTTEPSR
jgi:hypothetical protein